MSVFDYFATVTKYKISKYAIFDTVSKYTDILEKSYITFDFSMFV